MYAALAAFLPVLNIAASYVETSDSLTVFKQSWQYGLVGIVNLFEGFRRVHQVREAQTELQRAKERREELYLAIMLQVVRAYHAYKKACEAEKLAASAFRLAQRKLKQARALFREGLGTLADVLAAERAAEQADSAARVASYRRALAAVTLLDVCGLGPQPDAEGT